MAKILVTYDMFREGFTELESNYDVTFPEGRDFTYEEVLEMIPEYDVLCSMFDFPVNKELVDRAPNLKLVANYAVGYNNIDVAYCLEKGITVANTPDPVTAPTANLALGLMIDTARRITECDRKSRREYYRTDTRYHRHGAYRKGVGQTCECLRYGSGLP